MLVDNFGGQFSIPFFNGRFTLIFLKHLGKELHLIEGLQIRDIVSAKISAGIF